MTILTSQVFLAPAEPSRCLLIVGALATLALGALSSHADQDSARESPSGQKSSAVSAASAAPFLNVGVNATFCPQVQDFRVARLAPNLNLNRFQSYNSGTVANLSVTRTDFEFDLRLLEASVWNEVSLQTTLPLITVNSWQSNSNQKLPDGSEFGGIETRLVSGLFGGASELQIGYAQRNSTKLNLFDSHSDVLADLSAKTLENLSSAAWLDFRAGAGAEFPFAVQSPDNVNVHYGPTLGVHARVLSGFKIASVGDFKLGVEALFDRATSYTVAGIAQGGAGLLTLSPGASYLLIEGLWLGIGADLPVFRPAGREPIFGNSTLPGLYGPALSVSLRAAAI